MEDPAGEPDLNAQTDLHPHLQVRLIHVHIVMFTRTFVKRNIALMMTMTVMDILIKATLAVPIFCV